MERASISACDAVFLTGATRRHPGANRIQWEVAGVGNRGWNKRREEWRYVVVRLHQQILMFDFDVCATIRNILLYTERTILLKCLQI